MCRKRGFSLIEVMVAVAIMGMLLTAVFAIFKMGISAWFKTDGLTDLVQQGQVVGARFLRDVEASNSLAVSVTPAGDAICLPSARDNTGSFVLDPATLDLVWQKYVIYYFDGVSGEVRRREVPIAPPTRSVVRLESHTGQPLTNFMTGGIRIARRVTGFAAGAGGPMARLRIVAQKARPQTGELETQTSEFTALMRN